MDTAMNTNGRGKRPGGALSLADARQKTPAPALAGDWAEHLRAMALGAVNAADVTAIVQKQVEKAKAGDSAAAKFVLGYLAAVPPARPRPPVPERAGGEDAEEPRMVAVPSVATGQLRSLVALYLLQHQFALVGELARLTATEGETLSAVLNCDWFHEQNGKVTLTPAGRGAAG